MNGAFAIGAAALRAEQQAMETHANNVANVNTPGFKKAQNRFTEVMAETSDAAIEARALAGRQGNGGGGVRVSQDHMLFDQGNLRPTGRALDLAIDGRGFIELLGARGQALLWRGGTLRVNEDGQLATATGIPLRTTIAVPLDAAALTIAADGVVTSQTSSGETIELGQIALVTIEHEGAVEQLDGGLLRLLPDASVTDVVAGEDGAGRFVQGSIEESNAELTEEMVQMMIVQRAYAANAQIVQAADQLASITNNLKR
jgi:flagellar basal-body rod protein FlgG